MSIQFHSSVIISSNIDNLAQFYRSVLKQEIEFDFGSCIVFKCGLSLWNPDDAHVVRRHVNESSRGGGPLELCFETDDFENVMETLRNAQVVFLHDVQTENWGQHTARFFDPDKNLIEIGESIPCFVRRLYNEGSAVEAIAQKTSVPLEKVVEICKG